MERFVCAISLFVFVFSSFGASAQSIVPVGECRVNVDIASVSREKDRVRITVLPPPMKSTKIYYVLPAYLNDIGKPVDALQFVHDFFALDDRGMPLKVKKAGKNKVLIRLEKGRVLRKIEYWVDDSWDSTGVRDYHTDKYNHVPNAAGTTFDTESGFLLNPAFMIGYFDGAMNIPYRLTVFHNDDDLPFSAMELTESVKGRDVYFSPTYNDLVESPLYYGKADTCGFLSRNVYVDIAVYSESGNVSSRQIRKYIAAEVFALTRFMDGMSPRHYKMFFWIVSPERFAAGNHGRLGGMSHGKMAVYYLNEIEEDEPFSYLISGETAGDLLKVIPLLDQTRIENYPDFLVPQVRSNWWMAEGFKSYFTWLAEVRDSVASEEDFRAAISAKLRLCENVNTRSVTDLKQLAKALEDPIKTEQYKAKSMLLAFMLDINLTRWSGGNIDLRQTVLKLSGEGVVHHDSLCNYVAKNISGEVIPFCKNYINGNAVLPVIECFDKIGWVYAPSALDSILTFGQIGLNYNSQVDAFVVRNADPGNELRVKAGDRLVSVDGVTVSAANMDRILNTIYSPLDTSAIEVIYIRDNRNERVMAKPFYKTILIKHLVRLDPACSSDALLLHERIFNPMDY
jgi:predicted metalloprotease with PDZ domain